MRARVAILSILTVGFACRGYIPAHFAARPPVDHARDEAPIPVPRRRSIPEPVYLSEIYLHRPIREALDLSPSSEAADINSFDEVPKSSWFDPRLLDVGAMARGAEMIGEPRPPFTVLADEPSALASAGFSVRDSRGVLYEVAVDPPDRPELRTGALAVSSRIVWALGLNTPTVTITRVRAEDFWVEATRPDALAQLAEGAPPKDGYYRIAFVGWPAGRDLGRAHETGTRGDDPNDVIAHEDRRTVRALKAIASWLALAALGPAKITDRYVGAPGEGHVVHYFVGLDASLGASRVVRIDDPRPEIGGGSPFVRFLTLGLLPAKPRPLTQTEVPALGAIDEDFDPGRADLPLPYTPGDRMQSPDGYWAAKRIAALSSAHLALAIDGAKFSDGRAKQRMLAALEERRAKVLGYWFSRVVPLELVSFDGINLRLRDEAIALGLVPMKSTDFRVGFVGKGGERVTDPVILHPPEELLDLTLPEAALAAARDYLVLEITARRGQGWLPRLMEVHLRGVGDRLVVVAIRH